MGTNNPREPQEHLPLVESTNVPDPVLGIPCATLIVSLSHFTDGEPGAQRMSELVGGLTASKNQH